MKRSGESGRMHNINPLVHSHINGFSVKPPFTYGCIRNHFELNMLRHMVQYLFEIHRFSLNVNLKKEN
jgi:hypothetical protein